ncbi:MAG: adenosylcobinamide amidohydrolase [Actinomycetota bacterium]
MTEGEPLPLTWAIEASQSGPLLRAELAVEARCLSSSVLGGGLGTVRTWVNLQVPSGYRRTDPDVHLTEVSAGCAPPVVGMMTAAFVDRVQDVTWGSVRVLATVGLGHPIAAASLPGHEAAAAGPLPNQETAAGPRANREAGVVQLPGPAAVAAPLADQQAAAATQAGTVSAGTINIFATVAIPLSGAGLAGAFITATEAKAQALAAAGLPAANAPGPATGTVSDALAVACPMVVAAGSAFCGPATPHGADLARAVFEAVLRGCAAAGWGRSPELPERLGPRRSPVVR